MKCLRCKSENGAGRKFCSECGGQLGLSCPACGTPHAAAEKFCGECGAEIRGLGSGDSPLSYTPKHLADKILTSRAALEGERKQVTVLFADVKGSMELAGQLDPEEWHAILDKFFSILTEGVHRFEGTVNQYTGDGIMALFGAPIAHEDHARRACYAALHLLDGLRAYANELRLRRGLNFSARIGINSGEVIVGKIGDDLRMDYTAQGHTVGLAARMEQIAEPGKAYLTAHTAMLIDGYFSLADLGAMEIKGVLGAMHVFELQGLGQMRTRLDVSRSRGFSRFVGRGDEMQVLEAALARAREGNAQVVGIVGDAGLGKSRLCFEFLERCRSRGLMTYESTGVAHGKAIPLLPVLRLFRAFFGVTEQDSDSTARERIAGRLLLLDERLRESLPLNFEFMGVPDPENPAPKMDPEARQRQMFDIVRRVVQARGQKETTVTLLEDLHWFDGASAAFLEPLIDAAVGTRALLLLNFRPEYQAPWMGKSFYHQLPIAPLGADAIRELVEALLGNDPSTRGLADAIHQRTGGNPFFTEEVIQNLIESGKLQGSKGAYRLVTPIDKLQVPSSVQALLAARIDRLAEREKDVLQTAAVIGREFDEPTLAAVVEQDAPQLREALQKLKDTEFVYEQSLYPVVEYLFKHPLTQEVALASQLSERRRRLHAAVARVIEAAHADKIETQAALLAHHWEEAGEAMIAAGWHRRAARVAGSNDMAASMRHWQRVRELIEADADSPAAADLGADACRQTLAVGFRLGLAPEEEARAFSEGKRWAQRSSDGTADALLETAYSIAANMTGRIEEGVRHALEGQRLLLQAEDEELRALAPWTGSYPLFCAGQLTRSRELTQALLESSRGRPELGFSLWNLSAWAWSQFMLGQIDIHIGNLDTGREQIEQGIEVARRCGDAESEGWAFSWLAAAADIAGDVESGLGACQRSVEIAEKIGSPYSRAVAYFRLGVLLGGAGRWTESIETLEQTLAIARECRTYLEAEAGVVAALAEACLGAGDLARARLLAEESVALGRRIGAPLYFFPALRALAHVLLAQEGAAAAPAVRAALDEADRLVTDISATTLAPLILLDRAELARAEGEADRRERILRRAKQLFTDIGAPLRVQQIEALLAE